MTLGLRLAIRPADRSWFRLDSLRSQRTWTSLGKTVTADCPLTGQHDGPRSAPIRWLEREKTAEPWQWKFVDWDHVDSSTCNALITVQPGDVVAVWTVTNYAIGGRHVSYLEFPDLLVISNGLGRIVHRGPAFHWGFIERTANLYVMPFSANLIEVGDRRSTDLDALSAGESSRSDQ